jgi:hypothetical protein
VTLLSLTRTCRLTYPLALRLLYSRCLYIDTPRRLHRLIITLSGLSARNAGTQIGQPCTLPRVPLLRHITSLYLSPYPEWSIDDLPTANFLYVLFSLIAPALRRLVADIPLRSLYPPDDHLNVRPMLRRAFSQLMGLELFCSVRDELYLDCRDRPRNADEPYVWSLWPELRTLALYNADVSSARFWHGLGKLRHLETLILTRSDGLEEVDLKREWRRHCGDEKRGLCVFLVNVQSDHRVLMGREGWKEEDSVVVREVNVPISYYGDEDHVELCQEWVERKMLSGEVETTLTWWD